MKHMNCSCITHPVNNSLSKDKFDDLLWQSTKIVFGFNDEDYQEWLDYLNGRKNTSIGKWINKVNRGEKS